MLVLRAPLDEIVKTGPISEQRFHILLDTCCTMTGSQAVNSFRDSPLSMIQMSMLKENVFFTLSHHT